MNHICALVFTLPSLETATDSFEADFPGSIFFDLLEQIDAAYVLTADDHDFLAGHGPPPDVEVRVLVLLFKEDLPAETRNAIGRRWGQLIENFGVKDGDYPLTYDGLYKQEALAHRATDIAFSTVQHVADTVVTARSTNMFVSSLHAHRRNRDAARDMPLTGQQQSAQRRAAAQEQTAMPRIDWNNQHQWTCAGPDGKPYAYAIEHMEISLLYSTICWIFSNRVPLYDQYADASGSRRADLPMGMAAGKWLSRQPLFRSMIKTAISQQMTFPVELYNYLKDNLLQSAASIAITQPWNDPSLAHQSQELAGFLAEPTVLPEEIDPVKKYGKDFRSIDLS